MSPKLCLGDIISDFIEDLPQRLPTKFRFIWPSGFREDFLKSANQKQELPMAAMLVNRSGQISNLQRRPSIDASYQVSVHLSERFQRRRLKCEKLTDDRRTPSDGKSSHCLWQGELKTFSLGTLNCMDVLYYPPPLAWGNITHPCNSRYLGKIFLYIDHNHMEYLYIIIYLQIIQLKFYLDKTLSFVQNNKTKCVYFTQLYRMLLHDFPSMFDTPLHEFPENSVKVYDKQIITCHFLYHTLYLTCSYIVTQG